MPATLTSMRLDLELADEAAEVLGVGTRTEAIHLLLREAVATKRYKELLLKHGGKHAFAGVDE
jgi:Arc/MetJ family transcription regulator